MRAKFIVEVPSTTISSFPTNEEFESRLIGLGLGEQGRAASWELRLEKYVAEAEKLWESFPEVARVERDYVMFFARLPYHGELIVTRFDEGYAVFRVMNVDLAKLESGTERLVASIGAKAASLPGLVIVDDEVEIYERGHESVVIRGSIIARPLRETLRRHAGTAATTAFSGIAAVATLLAIAFAGMAPGGELLGTVERFSTAMLATFFVSLATLIQVWVSLSRKKHIDWVAVSTT